MPTGGDEERPPLVESVDCQDSPVPATGMARCRGRSVLMVPLLLCAFAMGAALTWRLQKIAAVAEMMSIPKSSYGDRQSTVRFGRSKASEVLGELSVKEVQAISSWFMAQTGSAACRHSPNVTSWLAGPSAVELLRPPKAETLAYLDGKGPKPPRFARVVMVTQSSVMEYKVGPADDLSKASITELVPKGAIPYSKRPGFEETSFLTPIYNAAVKEIGVSLLVRAFGPIWPQLAEEGGFVPGHGMVTFLPRNDPLAPAGTRRVRLKSALRPPLPSRPDAQWLYPLPLDMEVNITAWNVSEWKINHITFCGQGPYDSPSSLLNAFKQGQLHVCQTNFSSGPWDTPQRESPKVATRRESHDQGVSWGPWSFSVTQRPSTGIAVTDIRFRGERIVYELALMDAQAIYGGAVRDQFMYSDSAYTMSQWSTSLEPGVDCPDRATYLSAANWMGPEMSKSPDPRKAQEFWPICVFDWVEDHEIWRHMDGGHTRGYVRKTVVVRSIATVGNYDYIMDVKFREDGEINVETRFAGYPETRYPGKGEEVFSTIVRDGVAGIVHTHSVSWKADIEIAGGAKNALHVTEVREHESSGLGVNWKADENEQRFPTKILQQRYVEREGAQASTFVADAHVPKAWAIVNRNSSVTRGASKNPRGYRIELLSFATGQVHSASHPFVKAMPWTKYHLAVTKYQDNEYRPSSPYVNFDGLQPLTGEYAQDLDVFLSNNESLMDEDLVAWIGLNKEHIVRQEDIPLVSNFGASFSLQPFNFFEGNTVSNPPSEL